MRDAFSQVKLQTGFPWERFPPLVLVAHGSRDPRAQICVARLAHFLERRRPGIRVYPSFIELNEPLFRHLISRIEETPIVVPLLLSSGYHLENDVRALARSWETMVTSAIGPDEDLVEVLMYRLRQTQAPRETPTILAAAGSSDPGSLAEVQGIGRQLESRLGAPVKLAFIGGAHPRISDVVKDMSSGIQGVAISTYLLSPGRFSQSLDQLPVAWVARPLGTHRLVIDLILSRYDCAVRELGTLRESLATTVST